MDARLESQSLSLSFNKLLACIQAPKGLEDFFWPPWSVRLRLNRRWFDTMMRLFSMTVALILTVTVYNPILASVEEHFGIAKSVPKENGQVQSVSKIELWFTQAPQQNSVSIRLVRSDQSLVSAAIFDSKSDAPKGFIADLDHNLNLGEYEVVWRGIGQDGHVVNGSYSFMVSAE